MMHELIEKFDTNQPYPDIFPKGIVNCLDGKKRDYFGFRNLAHFKHVCSKLTQKEDNKCGISYQNALQKLLAGQSDLDPKEKAKIRNLVRSNLHRRGLISEEVYEEYKYSVDGTVVGYDVAKFAAGEADCIITPARQYIDFFYELYVNASYPWHVDDNLVRRNCTKLVTTIQELERQHIFIKITAIVPGNHVNLNGTAMMSDIPLFSHKESKDVDTMASVINERLLRKFYFAIMEDYYADNLSRNYGLAVTNIEGAMSIGVEFNEIKFFEDILAHVGAE
jgi:hypothetical protein